MAFTKPKILSISPINKFPSIFSNSTSNFKTPQLNIKNNLIDTYNNKYGNKTKKSRFLIQKIISQSIMCDPLILKRSEKKSISLKNKIIKTESSSIHEKPIEKEITNKKIDEIIPLNNNNIIQNEIKLDNLEKNRGKRRLAELIPGYKMRKEYYDFDEISINSNDSKTEKSIYKLPEKDDEWTFLIKKDVEHFENEKLQKKRNLISQQKKLKQALDDQVRFKQIKKEKENQIELKYHENLIKELKNLENFEKLEIINGKTKVHKAKEELDKQNKEIIKSKKYENLIEEKYKKNWNVIIEESLKEQENKIREKKLRDLEICRSMMKESNLNRQRILENEIKERENDIKTHENYINDMERKIKEKEENKKKKFEELQKKYGISLENLRIFEKKSNLNTEDELQLRYFKEKEKEEKEEEERRKEAVKIRAKYIRNELKKQIVERAEIRINEEKLNKDQANYWKNDSELFFNEEKTKKQKTKEKYLEYIQGLKNQWVGREKGNINKMNSEELLQNKELLKTFANESSKLLKEGYKTKRKFYM